MNWRGKNRSRASTAPSRGKPWYEVLAARTRIAKVNPWTAKYMNEVHEDDGNTARAISETTETLVLGRACMCTARYETPMNSVIAIPPMKSRVRAAFLPGGGRNALTPLEIASTPVNAAAPDANARRTTNTPTAPAPVATGSGTWTWAHVPVAHLPTPVPINASIAATKA